MVNIIIYGNVPVWIPLLQVKLSGYIGMPLQIRGRNSTRTARFLVDITGNFSEIVLAHGICQYDKTFANTPSFRV
jgi:hypothetical protein